MNVEKLNRVENALLVIDVQKQFNKPEEQYRKCIEYINESRSYYDLVIGTVFKNTLPNFYVFRNYTYCSDATFDDMEYKADAVIFKNTYGAYFKDILNVKHYDIIGYNAEASILATAFSMWDNNKDFFLLTEFIYSSNMKFLPITFEVMRRNFGECVV